MLRGFYRFHRFIGSQLKKITQQTDKTDMNTDNELAVLRMESEILWPERCAALEELLLSSLTLLVECNAQRNIARAGIANADALYQQHLIRVEAYRKKVAVVARNRA